MYKMLTACTVLAVMLLAVPAPTFAQVGSLGTELSLSISPAHPHAGEAITASVESYNIDLNRADVRWFVNDRMTANGVGLKHLQTSVGTSGELTSIRVVAIGEDGRTYSADLSIRPAEVNLLWQAQSYTPPFYKGKALMPYQGTVLVAAIPSFNRGNTVLSTQSLIYTWKEGDNVIGDSSGKGKNLFVFRGSVPLRTKTISVTVESPDHTMIADASIEVTPVAPRLLFYENHPRYGLLTGKALLGRFSLFEDEVHLSALPYYFETSTKINKGLVFEWQMNYQPLESERGSSIALRRTSSAGGSNNLFLEAHSADESKTFQAAEERLVVDFPDRPDILSAPTVSGGN